MVLPPANVGTSVGTNVGTVSTLGVGVMADVDGHERVTSLARRRSARKEERDDDEEPEQVRTAKAAPAPVCPLQMTAMWVLSRALRRVPRRRSIFRWPDDTHRPSHSP